MPLDRNRRGFYHPVETNAAHGGTTMQQRPGTVHHEWVTTGMEFAGHRIVQYKGVVRGIVVRSRSVVGTIGASLQTLFGGNITLWTELCERARQDAFDLMLRHATEHGANAIIGMRYDANEVAAGVAEVLAYGTAVVIERER
jgi:uncharacterized protein YbjQ (UPF0145 family)